MFCTYAATGKYPSFQAIYICNTCSDLISGDGDGEQQQQLCICSNCAVSCHENLGHSVTFVGFGESYCDCSLICRKRKKILQSLKGNDDDTVGAKDEWNCAIQEPSQIAAKNLGLPTNGCELNITIQRHSGCVPIPDFDPSNVSKLRFPYEYGVFTIPELSPNESGKIFELNDCLVDQAEELIRHTSDTHFLFNDSTSGDGTINIGNSQEKEEMCLLEQLAWSIFQRHIKEYNLAQYLGDKGGAEWWVQVKRQKSVDDQNEAIDLHYDKDEDLAAEFDLGSFPSLSTVTYLSDSFSPTLVFAHEYNMPYGSIGQSHEKEESQMIMSYPRIGKHLCFDGRLLHGAPSNFQLRQYTNHIIAHKRSTQRGLRVTFLVNIWLNRCPSCVTVLPSNIRSKIKERSSSYSNSEQMPLSFQERRISSIHVPATEDDATLEDNRIKLPFVSKGATWIEDEEVENDSGLVVSVHLPSISNNTEDTTIFHYDTPLEPVLENLYESSDEHYSSEEGEE